MGWLKKAAKRVSKGISGAVKNPVKTFLSTSSPLGATFRLAEEGLKEMSGKPPGAPGVDPNLANLQSAQVQYAKDFRGQLPELQSKMSSQLTQDVGRNLQQDLRGSRSTASARGLLYGGVQQGKEARQRAAAQKGLMSGISNINMGLQDAANYMDASAIQSGVNMQAQQQALQNLIYQNAMARQAGQNQIIGSAASAGMLAGMV